MLDPAFVRDNPELVRTGLRNRGLDPDGDLEKLAAIEARRRAIIPEAEGLKQQQNRSGEEVARAKKEGRDPSAVFAANRERGQRIKQLEAEVEAIEQERRALLLTIPNLPSAKVPVGASAADNVEVRRVGEPRQFDFEPQAHWDLGPALGIIDFERAVRTSGARFAFLVGAGARVSRALINFMLALHTREHGYTEVEPPFLV
ncbi:MAG: serine--tRNA ligase, partial [Acidobacteria bacterium]